MREHRVPGMLVDTLLNVLALPFVFLILWCLEHPPREPKDWVD